MTPDREAFEAQARALGLTTDQYADLLVKAVLDSVRQRRTVSTAEAAPVAA